MDKKYKCNKNISFALGTCIIFSKKVYDIMIEKIHLFNHNIEDDVANPVDSEEIEEKDPLKYFSEMEND